ncbi:MAG: glycosyltransferase, partial [Acidimicrobiia bacterium]
MNDGPQNQQRRGQLDEAIQRLESYLRDGGTSGDPEAVDRLLTAIGELARSVGVDDASIALGISTMSERVTRGDILADAFGRAFGVDPDISSALKENGRRLEEAEDEVAATRIRLERVQRESRDARIALERSESERRAAVEQLSQAVQRADTHAATLNDIYASRAWKASRSLWSLTRLIPGRGTSTEGQDAQRTLRNEPMPDSTGQRGLVSVIMPVYNKGPSIHEAIASVRAQTYTDVEVVVWDDGSTDPATLNALEVIKDDPDVVLVRAANQGVIGARNSAMRISQGEYLVCLDPDDRLEPTYLEKATLYLRTHFDVAIVYPWQRTVGSMDEVWETQDLEAEAIVGANLLPICSMFRRTVFDATGGFSADMEEGFEDWEFWAHAASLGFVGRVIPEPLFEYHHSFDEQESRDAAAREIRDELAERIAGKYGDRDTPVPTLRPSILEPTSLNVQVPNLPRGEGTPIILTLPWFTVGGADAVVARLVKHWTAQGRNVVAIATLGVTKPMRDRFDELLALTPYAYQLPSILAHRYHYDFVRAVAEA